MVSGRKPKPAHLKILTGNPGKRPIPVEPVVVEPLGDPPPGWKSNAKQLWWEIQSQIPPGVATKSDRQIFELTVRLIARIREKNSVLTPAMAAQIRVCLGCFAMTPADRARITVLPRVPEEEDQIAKVCERYIPAGLVAFRAVTHGACATC